MLKPVLFQFVLVVIALSEAVKYDNYSLLKVRATSEDELRILQKLQDEMKSSEFWSDHISLNSDTSVVVSPSEKEEFHKIIKENKIYSEVVLDNIQKAIRSIRTQLENENKELIFENLNFSEIDRQGLANYTGGMQWDRYYNLDAIYSWLDDLVSDNPGVATIITAGRSFERRTIKGIKISHGSGRKVIFIEGGIHAREWISPATVNYITYQLLYSNDSETIAAAREFDWHIFPVSNPDGYVFTEEDRLWRKNRKPFGSSFGVDLNRNWNSNWLVIGASTTPSSNTFAGIGPFSEIEVLSLARYIEDVAPNMDLYLSFHSSGQLLLLPYGNTTDPLDNYYDAIKIGRRALGSLSVRYGTQYTAGNIAEAIYFAAGSSIDWVKERFRVPLVYCYELRDRGEYGHLLPPEQILPNSEEVMDSILALIREARYVGYMNN